MYRAMLRYATPFITGFFVISLVSGIALFFHTGTSYFREMHEWLSMVLIAPFLLHLAKNWRPFLMYFKHTPMAIALVVSLVAGGVFAYQGMSGNAAGGNPAMALVSIVQTRSLATIAPVFGHTGDSLKAALIAKGYTIASVDISLAEIIKQSGKDSFEVIADLAALNI
jgi:hypothetical protein